MTSTSIAISEIIRVAPLGLRALGCPSGAVDRLAKILAFSEALEGGCLKTLRLTEENLGDSFNAKPPSFTRKSHNCGIVHGEHRTLLDVGTRAIDLLTASARASGTAGIRIQDVSDLLGLSGICMLAASRGVDVLALVFEGGVAGDRWFLYRNMAAGIEALSGRLSTGQPSIPLVLGKFGALADNLLVRPLSRDNELSCYGVDLIGLAHNTSTELSGDIQNFSDSDVRRVNVSEILRAAYAQGIVVEMCDLKFLYELETRAWAPTSERSRLQAGFEAKRSAS